MEQKSTKVCQRQPLVDFLQKNQNKNIKQAQIQHSHDQYIQFLKQHNFKIHPNLQPAIFYLRNQLPYEGLQATQIISDHQNLVVVPVEYLLTSHVAAQKQQLKTIYLQKFYHQGPVWQDRILITYLMYLKLVSKQIQLKIVQQDQISERQKVWIKMVKNMPKSYTILSFWPQQDITKFKDPIIQTAVKLQKKNFNSQWEQFTQIKDKYLLFTNNPDIFNFQNYQYLYVHTVSRCFGSYMNSTYFAPYCQLFNHNCVNVSYACTQQKSINVGQIKQQKFQQNQILNDNDSLSSSSANSEQYIEDEDFDYSSVSTYIIKWCSKICFDLKQKQTKQINQEIKYINDWLNSKLIWNGYSLVFFSQLIQKLRIVQNQYMAGRRKFKESLQELKNLQSFCDAFRKASIDIHRRFKERYDIKESISKICERNGVDSTQLYAKQSKPPEKQYHNFIMSTRTSVTFKQKEQIYFSYGKLSNRTLLIRYGFCLQQNKSQHVWIKVKLNKWLSAYPDALNIIAQKSLPIVTKIKIKPRKLCIQLILLMKSFIVSLSCQYIQQLFYIWNFNVQIRALQNCQQICINKLMQYGQEYEILAQKMDYYEYWRRVYRNSKRQILKNQIYLLHKAVEALRRIQKNVDQKKYQVKIDIKKQIEDINDKYLRKKLQKYFNTLQAYVIKN